MYIQKQENFHYFGKIFHFSSKIRRLQVQPDAAGGEFFILFEFTIEKRKFLSLNHLTRRFCKNRRVLRRQTPRRPPETVAIASSILRNMQGKRGGGSAVAVPRSPSSSQNLDGLLACH
jgi:hypothetical protein